MNYTKRTIAAALLSCSLLLTGCGAANSTQAVQPSANVTAVALANSSDPEADQKSIIFVESMDTFMTLTAYGSSRDKVLDMAKAEIERLNDLFSIGVESSDISLLNASGSYTVTDETALVIRRAMEINSMTGGLFDISVLPIMELWGFTNKEYKVPSTEELSSTLLTVGPEKVSLNDATGYVELHSGSRIDLGGIAKGYTSGKVIELMREAGLESAIISLGGNIHCLNLKPDGSRWKVGIRDPRGDEGSYCAVIEVENKAVITSGGYERYFIDEETDTTYCHIIDPATGIPVDSDLLSVSIISEDGALADGLSTSLYIMGLEKASEFWKEYSDLFDIFLIDDDGNMYASEGLEGLCRTVGGEQVNIIRH